jgi:hypothetical protein
MMEEEEKGTIGVSFIGESLSFTRLPPLGTNHLPRAPSPWTIALGIRF